MNFMNVIKQYMLQGITPQNMLQKMNIRNPILSNVINMAQKGDTKGVEKFARNVCNQRGLDFDTEFAKFKNTLK